MPLFTYTCRSCGTESELLVLNGAKPQCPGCASDDLVKLASHFATAAASSASELAGCPMAEGGCDMGGCGMGHCGMFE